MGFEVLSGRALLDDRATLEHDDVTGDAPSAGRAPVDGGVGADEEIGQGGRRSPLPSRSARAYKLSCGVRASRVSGLRRLTPQMPHVGSSRSSG